MNRIDLILSPLMRQRPYDTYDNVSAGKTSWVNRRRPS